MNGVHDMGGMQCFGPVLPETNEPVFHAEWEARALAITLAMAGWGKWNIDSSRHARETLPPADYLRFSYYERWIAALTRMMVEHGLVTSEELESGQPDPGSPKARPPLDAAKVREALRRGGPTARPLDREPRFALGQKVRAINAHPKGHTRLPATPADTSEMCCTTAPCLRRRKRTFAVRTRNTLCRTFHRPRALGKDASPRDSITDLGSHT